MRINRKNYEAYILDYREKNLTPEQVTELFVFLEQNPDLKEALESFEVISLVADKNIRFEYKKELKKYELIPTDHINSYNYDEYFIRELEGDLTEDESIELKAFIELNPKTKLEYNIYRSTFLKPDLSVRFENKEKLKKTGFFVIHRKEVIYGLSLAASIVVFLGIYFGFLRKEDERLAGTFERIIPLTDVQTPIRKISTGENGFPPGIEPRNIIQDSHSASNPEDNLIPHEKQVIFNMALRQPVKLKADNNGLPGTTPEQRNTGIARNTESVSKGLRPGTKEKSFASRFVTGLANKMIKFEKSGRKSFLEITVDGYNFIADKEVIFEKKLDDNGKVIAFSLNGENISFSRNRSHSIE